MSRDYPSNNDDVIDSRQIIERIEELRSERESAAIHTTCRHCGQDIEGRESDDEWRDRGNNTTCPTEENKLHEPPEDTCGELPEDEAEELAMLEALADEAEGYSPDWRHGETLIRDSYFEQYAQELADDLGLIQKDQAWPYTCIDWERAARELQQDYTSVEFGDVTYWVRS